MSSLADLDLAELFEYGAYQGPTTVGTAVDSLPRTLGLLRDHYLVQQGLRGRLTYDARLPVSDAPEAPLRSVLEHLVEGALRTNSASRPAVHVGVASESDEHVTLLVRDNAAPLPFATIEELRAMVGKATVADLPDRVYRLFLADNLASWMGGSLWVEPTEEERGNTVYLKIPRVAPGPTKNPLLGRHVF